MSVNETPGIDEAWSKADPAATYAAGYRLVLGYCSRDLSKTMTRPWREAYRAAGLAVGLVFEDGADRALGGAAAGTADGLLAEGQANAAGYDPAAVIFFAVDFDATAAQIAGPIADYAAGFAAATSRPAGVYGSCAVVDALVTPGQGPVRYGWQTAAWSGGQVSGKASIYQRIGHTWPLIPGIAANAFDEDVITAAVPLDGGTLTTPGDDMFSDADRALLTDVQNRIRGSHPAMDSLQVIQWQVGQLAAAPEDDPGKVAAAIAAAIPADLAQQVVTALGTKLAHP